MERLLIGCANGLVGYSLDTGKGEWLVEGPAVPVIAVDPGNPERVYAATLGKGLWASEDGGATFTRCEGLDNSLAWTVTVSAADRSGPFGAVYVGTQLSAIYRSTDGGQTFEELTSVQEIPTKEQWSFPPAPDTHHLHQIALHPTNPDIITFGIELGGVYRSTDRGLTWAPVNADPDPHVLRTHPGAPDRIYQNGGGSYRQSEDAGATWERSLDGIGDEYRYFYSMVVDTGDPDLVLATAGYSPFSGHALIPGIPVFSTVFRRAGTGAWEEVLDGMPPREGTAMGTLLAAEPGTFYYITEEGELYQSVDAGRSFSLVAVVEVEPAIYKARQLAGVGLSASGTARPSLHRQADKPGRRPVPSGHGHGAPNHGAPNHGAPDPALAKKRQFRLAVQNIAAPPQAQRRYAQLGWLRNTVTSYVEMSADRDLLARELGFGEEQIALLQELGTRLAAELAGDPNFIDDKGAKVRDYMYTDALQTEQWHSLRLLARRCWTLVVGAESPFLAIRAM